MLVYRIETPEGEGPWVVGDSHQYNYCTQLDDDCYDPPPAQEEDPSTALHKFWDNSGKDQMPAHIRFGFESKEQLIKWFPCSRGRAGMTKCHLSVYEVDDYLVMKGHWQLIFNKDQARLVKTLDLETLA